MARGEGSRRRRGGLVEIGPRVGTASPKASWDSRQGGELGVGAQFSISQAPPWPLQARKSKLCPEAPQREWAVSLARLPREGWRVLKEAGGCAANSWKGSLMKNP